MCNLIFSQLLFLLPHQKTYNQALALLKKNDVTNALLVLDTLETNTAATLLLRQKAIFLKGDVHFNLNENDLARDEYLKLAGASLADELRKDKVCFQLAMCYYRLEDRNCANQWWQTILSEVPNTPLRKQIEFWLGK